MLEDVRLSLNLLKIFVNHRATLLAQQCWLRLNKPFSLNFFTSSSMAGASIIGVLTERTGTHPARLRHILTPQHVHISKSSSSRLTCVDCSNDTNAGDCSNDTNAGDCSNDSNAGDFSNGAVDCSNTVGCSDAVGGRLVSLDWLDVSSSFKCSKYQSES